MFPRLKNTVNKMAFHKLAKQTQNPLVDLRHFVTSLLFNKRVYLNFILNIITIL